jgi:monoamine oxidase
MEEGERIKLIKRQVEQVQNLPRGYLDDMVLDYKTIEWDRENWALGAFALYNPEQKRIFSYEMIKPEYDDHVFFAGEHVSPTHAFIQGALYSGMLAANSLAYHAVRR